MTPRSPVWTAESRDPPELAVTLFQRHRQAVLSAKYNDLELIENGQD